MAQQTDRFLLLPEVGNICRVSVETVRHWLKVGKLHGIRMGRRRVVERATLERFIAGREPIAYPLAPDVRQLDMFDEELKETEPIESDETKLIVTGRVLLLCPKCNMLHKVEWRHVRAEKAIRNQPRCNKCRGGPKSKKRQS